ncbi:bile acid:sodium symporter family protein [Virgibacillus sediminis]|uniref:Bile acid:sodium symporter family protein n=1 Tax=Virgibacillus sediminis TaxID=202260 RepID=A0ABV7A397_9BACI
MNFLNTISKLAGKYFAVLVIVVAAIAFFSPDQFSWLGAYVSILLGIVMFGMGLTLKAVDFKLILTKPVPVLIGVAAQFIIMPLAAFSIAYLLDLPPAVAAGLVLLGSVPGGTSSNVMVYLAKGDVALSIAMTSFSTLLAPVATPFILLMLAGQWMPVDPAAMFLSIFQVIIVPIVLGLLIKRMFPTAVEKSIDVVPLISVTAIIIIVAAVVSGNVESIASSGLLVFASVVIHNAFGVLLGYLAALAMRLDETKRRAISLEVGMQNSGLGVSLATVHFEPLAALPSAAAAVWHNITGSLLASFWSKRKVGKEEGIDSEIQPTGKAQ